MQVTWSEHSMETIIKLILTSTEQFDPGNTLETKGNQYWVQDIVLNIWASIIGQSIQT